MSKFVFKSSGFLGLLAILFIAFKLAHIINWSWWWVLTPLWIPAFCWLFIVSLILTILFIIRINSDRW